MYAYISETIENTLVISDLDSITTLYKNGYFGRSKNNKLYLQFVEALYLLYKKKIEISFGYENNFLLNFKNFFLYCSLNENNFELKYIVYKDLKERGYYVRSNAEYFRLYPRSSNPSKTRSKYFIYIKSEMTDLNLNILINNLKSTENVHKELILAVVDEESDITYYKIKNLNTHNFLSQNINKSLDIINPINAVLLEERIIIFDNCDSFKLYSNFFYGKPLDESRLQLSFIEALYLAEKNIIQIYDLNNNKVSLSHLTTKAMKKDSFFNNKYEVYKDLRGKFFIPKTGFKFGSHFRLYDNFNSNLVLSHSKYLLHVISNNYVFDFSTFSRFIRLSNSVKKGMIFSFVVPNENKIEYILIERTKL